MLAGQGSPFEDFIIRRIGHDAAEFDDIFPGSFQDTHDFVVNARALDGTAAIRQDDATAILAEQVRQVLGHAFLAKISFRTVFKDKVFHRPSSYFNYRKVRPKNSVNLAIAWSTYFGT